MAEYLVDFGPNSPVSTLEEIAESKTAIPGVQDALEKAIAGHVAGGIGSPGYEEAFEARERLIQSTHAIMEELDIDAFLYPHQSVLVAKVGEPQLERNGNLSNGTGFPAITFQGGFSEPSPDAPDGVPIGLEFLGKPLSEQLLLDLTYTLEKADNKRKPPSLL